jgi:hypothetical protein
VTATLNQPSSGEASNMTGGSEGSAGPSIQALGRSEGAHLIVVKIFFITIYDTYSNTFC